VPSPTAQYAYVESTTRLPAPGWPVAMTEMCPPDTGSLSTLLPVVQKTLVPSAAIP
jgi:hypothetical protein